MKTGKQYLSLFLVLFFLFPQVEKAIHDIQHLKDSHCSEKSLAHFHKKEHSCAICDFNIPASNTPAKLSSRIILSVISVNYFEFTGETPVSVSDYQSSPRAPPLV